MSIPQYDFYKVAASIPEIIFDTNNIATLEAGGHRFCMALYKLQLFAFAEKCPHASGKMDEGYIDVLGNVVCPIHRYRFSLKNGYNTSGEGYFLKTYPVELREDGIYVGFKKGLV